MFKGCPVGLGCSRAASSKRPASDAAEESLVILSALCVFEWGKYGHLGSPAVLFAE